MKLSILLFLSLLGAGNGAAEPVAVVVSVDGAAEVQRAAGAEREPAHAGMRLVVGDRVLPDGGEVVLLFRTGARRSLTEAVVIEDPQAPESAGVFTRTIRTLNQVAATDAAQHPNRQGMIRPIPGLPAPISPRNGLAVLDGRPTLTWFSVPNARGHILQLRREGETPVRIELGPDTTWAPGPAAAPLQSGLYEWSVASQGGRATSPERFRVPTPAELAELAPELAEIEALGLDPAGDGLFLAALTYHDRGFIYAARDALFEMAARGDAGGRSYWLLRGVVLDALGELEGAAEAFRRADAGE